MARVDIDYFGGGGWRAVNIGVGDCDDGLTMVTMLAAAFAFADAVVGCVDFGWDADSLLDLPHCCLNVATEIVYRNPHAASGDCDLGEIPQSDIRRG